MKEVLPTEYKFTMTALRDQEDIAPAPRDKQEIARRAQASKAETYSQQLIEYAQYPAPPRQAANISQITLIWTYKSDI
jgi:hypothetical protein